MKDKLIIGVILGLLFIFSGFLTIQLTKPSLAVNKTIYHGFLLCQSCATEGMAKDGTKVGINPEQHTVKCLKMPGCMASGYGLMSKNNGKYTFYKFDQKGSDLAYQKIICRTKKKNNLTVEIIGKMENNILTVRSIKELN